MHPEPAVRDHREFAYGPADFAAIRKLIHAYAGISLASTKHEMVYSRLARRLRARGLSRFSEYIKLVDGRDPGEREAFVNALTTNLTSFFRERHHYTLLAHALSEWRAKRREPISIWCAGCSTGEEAYSVAMTAVDAFSSYQAPVNIIATDVDTDVLVQAARGAYARERLARLSAEQLRRFFLRRAGDGEGVLSVRPELRDLITFRKVNLLSPDWPVRSPFEVIFCRNVMIYFDRMTQRSMLERFLPLLAGDGLLFVGHSESLLHAADLFRLRGNTVYERAQTAARVPRSRGC